MSERTDSKEVTASWNYRVIRSRDGDHDHVYYIHEVHYENDKIVGWSANPATVMSDTRDGLLGVLIMMASAVSKPILEENATGFPIEVEPERQDKYIIARLERVDHLQEIRGVLRELYDPAAAEAWLFLPHPGLAGQRAMDLIAAGRGQEVMDMIQRLKAGTYG